MRIVLATLGSLGDLFPMLSVALALRARGHEAVMAAAPCYAARITALGLTFRPLRPDFPPEVMTRVFADPFRSGKHLLAEHVFPAARETYADLLEAAQGADAILAGEAVYVAPLVAEKLGLPWANVMLSPLTMLSAQDPSVLTWFPAAYHLRHLGTWPQRAIMRFMRRMTNAWAKPVFALQRELGAAPRDIVFSDKFSPHLVLALFPAAFGPLQQDWPAASVQTGFPYFAQEASPDTAARLSAFLAAGPAPVVFTLGSTVVNVAEDFYQVAADTAVALGRRAILLIGKNPPPNAPADQVLSLDFVPHGAVFPHAAAVVQHGGVGGCAEAVRAGVPVLTIPVGLDQPDNAERMRRMGVGKVLAYTRVNRANLEHSLRAVLDDAAMATRAQDIARAMDPAADMDRTVDAIEAMVRRMPAALVAA